MLERISLDPIIKITGGGSDFYLEWNILYDGPSTYGMSLEEFKDYYKQEYGNRGMLSLPERLKIVEETGCSIRPSEDRTEGNMRDYLLNINRAGKNKTKISIEDIFKIFYLERPLNKYKTDLGRNR